MKITKIILSICLLLVGQPLLTSISAENAEVTSTQVTQDKHPANIYILGAKFQTRSLSLSAYIEDSQLYILFEGYLQNKTVTVTDVETGNVVYSDTFTGDTLIIPLTGSGESYTIEIN